MILAIDIGTTALKAALVSNDGTLVSSVQRILSVHGSGSTDASQWMMQIESASSEMAASFDKHDIQAVIVDANGPTLVPYPETEAMLWMDRRAQSQSREASKAAGFFLDSSFIVPKVMWLKENRLDIYEKTKWFFGSQDYVNYILTGVPTTLMPLQGLEKWYWDSNLLSRVGLDEDRFPPFVSMGTIIGKLRSAEAQRMGLEAGIPVIAGCPDFVTSIIGTATMKPGIVCDRSGTSDGINLCSSISSSDQRLMCYRHPNGTDWNISGSISTTGASIASAMKLLGLAPQDYDGFYELCRRSSPGAGSIVFNPYLCGERSPIWDSNAKGTFFGLTIQTTREDIARSVCEGTVLAIHDVLEAIGQDCHEIRVTGGPAGNAFLNQLKADVTQKPVVTMQSSDSELLGLAIIGLKSLGCFSSISEGAEALVKAAHVHEPDSRLSKLYQNSYSLYKSVYQTLKTLPST